MGGLLPAPGEVLTVQYVTVILDRYDGSGSLVTQGRASWAPSQELPDPADQMLVGQQPVTADFDADGPPSVKLAANDTIGPQQENGNPGWTWDVTYLWVPGAPAAESYYILSANGDTQRLSQLAQTPAAEPGQQYVPLRGGVALGGAIAPRDITLVDAATVTPALGAANDFTLLMTSAVGSTRAIAACAPLADCQTIRFLLVQPPSGGPCGVAWASGADGYDFGSAGAPQLTPTANQGDIAAFQSRTIGNVRKWRYLGDQGGYS